MKILLMGQCSLHWGRMEFGNIGNYYIIEPFIRELHRVFPGVEIRTTFQMSKEFCDREKITVLPMQYYYGWEKADKSKALAELEAARAFKKNGYLPLESGYIKEVLSADMVIDFSGDIWGSNADFLGPDRFFVGLCKDRVAQLLGKKTVMLAGSPGPFPKNELIQFAQEVFAGFDLVTNREPISKTVLRENGFQNKNMIDTACPAFLFTPDSKAIESEFLVREYKIEKDKPVVGFIVCGWNFSTGPFDKWPREEEDFLPFVESVEFIDREIDANVVLMSHSNGFPIPPAEFQLIHGRDYPIIKEIQAIINKRRRARKVIALDGVFDAWTTKGLIKNFDMLVSGRVHGAVAGLSQHVPTVLLDYGHEPKAHKIKGFASVANALPYVVEPLSSEQIIITIKKCWENRIVYKNNLEERIPEVKTLARSNFDILNELFKKE